MLFSFIISKRTIMITKDIDEIMIEIKNNYSNYNVVGMNAKVSDKYITPGVCERKVNINKSYNEMRKIGFYNPNNYIYNNKRPSINIYNNLDKYIVNGNKTINNIYIFIELNNINKKYININKFSNYNFIVNTNFYINNKKLINELISNNNSIILIPTLNKKQYKYVYNDYLVNTNKRIYCYNNKENNNLLNICIKYKSNSIGNITTYNSNYLYNIKSYLSNGLFIKFELNNELINELLIINKYIESKGYNIKNIDNNLGEC